MLTLLFLALPLVELQVLRGAAHTTPVLLAGSTLSPGDLLENYVLLHQASGRLAPATTHVPARPLLLLLACPDHPVHCRREVLLLLLLLLLLLDLRQGQFLLLLLLGGRLLRVVYVLAVLRTIFNAKSHFNELDYANAGQNS